MRRVDGLCHVAHDRQIGPLLVEVHLGVVLVEVDVCASDGVRLLDGLLVAETATVEVATNLEDLLRHVVQTEAFLAHALGEIRVVGLHGHQLAENDVVLLLVVPGSLRGSQVGLPRIVEMRCFRHLVALLRLLILVVRYEHLVATELAL